MYGTAPSFVRLARSHRTAPAATRSSATSPARKRESSTKAQLPVVAVAIVYGAVFSIPSLRTPSGEWKNVGVSAQMYVSGSETCTANDGGDARFSNGQRNALPPISERAVVANPPAPLRWASSCARVRLRWLRGAVIAPIEHKARVSIQSCTVR